MKLVSLESLDDIVEAISEIKYDDKFMIFVDTIETGNKIKKDLHEVLGISVPFHKSKYHPMFDTYDSFQDLIRTSNFDDKGIIATSTLDNGINLKNYNIKHIFIFITDQEEFIQMIGRKRFISDEEVTIYILNRKCDYYTSKENRLRIVYDTYQQMINLNDSQVANKLLNNYSNKIFSMFTFFSWNYFPALNNELSSYTRRNFHFNSFSIFRIRQLLNYYSLLHAEYVQFGEDPLKKHVSSWLNIQACDISNFISKKPNVISITNEIIKANLLIEEPITTKLINPLFKQYFKLINAYLPKQEEIKPQDDISVSKFEQFLNHENNTCDYKAEVLRTRKIKTGKTVATEIKIIQKNKDN